ncbi:protein shisa-4-like [Centruroides sculpturatus]|uniref:protein shisa-4-like n=1 Tax=Centruroides sculpturatus TaxID=218467 RepID=UPI000C6E14BE|nr:protein shisa-4-like [Centruroides sculpturatus]
MKSSSVLYSLIFTLFGFLQQVASYRCSKEIFGRTIYLNCPEAGDSPDKKYCCGTEKIRYCCNTEEFAKTINAIGLIIGVLISAIVVIVVIVVVSCFCCSCCLLAKRRQQRGRVLYGKKF